MKQITPRAFMTAFVAVMKTEHANFRTAVGFEDKSYTYFMRSNIFPKIAKQLGLMIWNKEYHALETMFYEERGEDRSGRYTSYAKWVSVALAHENQPARTPEQINKLQLYNVPLKVLISYAAEGDEANLLLKRYESVIADADVFNDIGQLRKQLVIFGTPKTVHEWQFHVYEDDGFVLMLPAG